MSYLGDFSAGTTIDFKFTTRRFSSGAPFALATGNVLCWKSNSTSYSTAGMTLTSTFGGFTGVNHVNLNTGADGTFYANGGQFEVMLSTGTVDGISVAGEIVRRFSLGLNSLTGTQTFNMAGSVQSVSSNVVGSVGSVAGNVSGNVVGSVASVSSNVGGSVVGSVASVSGNVSGSVASVVGNVGGNVSGSVGSVAGLSSFASTGGVLANIAYVNGVKVNGDGSSTATWGP